QPYAPSKIDLMVDLNGSRKNEVKVKFSTKLPFSHDHPLYLAAYYNESEEGAVDESDFGKEQACPIISPTSLQELGRPNLCFDPSWLKANVFGPVYCSKSPFGYYSGPAKAPLCPLAQPSEDVLIEAP